MARAEPQVAGQMKAALLHWFNTVGGTGCGGSVVASMADLWKEHVPALLLYLKGDCTNLKGARGSSSSAVYEEARAFMMSSTESKNMAGYLNAVGAANGNDLEISKFLLLFWHEICISDSKTIENSISFMEQVNLQHTMGDAIEWMNKATENQDYSRWYHVLFDSPVEEDDNVEEAGDARTPTADESIERLGEDIFIYNTPSNLHTRHSLYEAPMARHSLMGTPRLSSARRQLPLPSSEPRHFTVPHLPVSRGSPIAEQLNSPAMREKRRERELRTMQSKLTTAQEERDSREMDLKEMKKQRDEQFESNHQLKSKLDDALRDLTKENNLREKAESEMEVMRKEKKALSERFDHQSTLVQKLKHDMDLSLEESTRLNGTIEELERQLSAKSRDMVDLKDELESKTRMVEESRATEIRLEGKSETMKNEIVSLKENLEDINKDWRRRMNEMEENRADMETIHHESIGKMSAKVMKSEKECMEVKEELENEKKKYEEWRKKNEEEMEIMKEDTEKEKRKMIEEMREKKEKLNEFEVEREKSDKEKEEEMRELRRKYSDMEVLLIEAEGTSMSLKQKLSTAIANGETMTQKVDELKMKTEAATRVNGQLKETIEEMDKEKMERETELARLRKVDEKNEQMKEKIEKMTIEMTEVKEKAYSTLLENDQFTQQIMEMKKAEEERIKEEEWNWTQLQAEVVTANKEKHMALEEMRMIEKKREEEKIEREEEKKKEEEKMMETNKRYGEMEEEFKQLKFLHKNEKRELMGLRKEKEAMEEIRKENEELKEDIDRLKREMKGVMEIGKENMENVVGKKKELEVENEKKDKLIEKLNAQINKMNEDRDLSMRDTSIASLTTVKRDIRGNLAHTTTLMDYEEEPIQLYSKSNLGGFDKEYMEVDDTLTSRDVLDKLEEGENKENDTNFMVTPSADRRQIPTQDSKMRLNTIASRNAKTLPHLRSSHAVESMSPDYSQEGLRDGFVRPPSARKLNPFKKLLNKN
ncbi:hypothetical protein PFISCL1PPCAC_6051 [Pristionchus fissidentatus]|uniref:Uncharacterized protein n=1 Tax=Pristionchus fissidentatus TaxID=1538716 RepID=A0AAV5VA48_9BILA|nr:hypothetical protein PFISCL1PPCAC_6051 [Pristionchus fissidentatus]